MPKQRNRTYEAIGDFLVTSPEIRVSDPGYDKDVWCCGVLKNMREGRYEAYVAYCDDRVWGHRVEMLLIKHEGSTEKPCLANTVFSTKTKIIWGVHFEEDKPSVPAEEVEAAEVVVGLSHEPPDGREFVRGESDGFPVVRGPRGDDPAVDGRPGGRTEAEGEAPAADEDDGRLLPAGDLPLQEPRIARGQRGGIGVAHEGIHAGPDRRLGERLEDPAAARRGLGRGAAAQMPFGHGEETRGEMHLAELAPRTAARGADEGAEPLRGALAVEALEEFAHLLAAPVLRAAAAGDVDRVEEHRLAQVEGGERAVGDLRAVRRNDAEARRGEVPGVVAEAVDVEAEDARGREAREEQIRGPVLRTRGDENHGREKESRRRGVRRRDGRDASPRCWRRPC